MSMYAPIRGGTRGGAGDFKWSDVKDDNDRENYLGHSLLAPKGRWQNNRDITWYTKNGGSNDQSQQQDEDELIKQELFQIKQNEEDAIALALGFQPTPRTINTNQTALPPPSMSPTSITRRATERAEARINKEARKADRAEKRSEKAAKRERRKESDDSKRRRRSSRSRSPDVRERERERESGSSSSRRREGEGHRDRERRRD